MTGFHDVSLPMRLALGAVGGPEWRTEIVSLASGAEVRNSAWSQSRRRWDIGSAVTDLVGLQTLVAFFEARSGPLYGFRFRDPLDHCSAAPAQAVSANDQSIGIGDGVRTQFQLSKAYGSYLRRISKPIPDSVEIGLDGSADSDGWSLDPSTGVVSFETPPLAGVQISAGFEFECPVRFENTQIQAVIEAFNAGRVVSLGLVELMEAGS